MQSQLLNGKMRRIDKSSASLNNQFLHPMHTFISLSFHESYLKIWEKKIVLLFVITHPDHGHDFSLLLMVQTFFESD